MKLDRYELKSDDQLTFFTFLSEGQKGKIEKVVQFSLIYQNNLYNLSFGDRDYLTGQIDDKIVTDNGDSEKVLATVVAAIYAFCDKVPDAFIYATGSTAARTRLYRMGINKYYDIVKEDFKIFGQSKSEWEQYKKGKDYEAFVVQKKSIKFDI
jgi:acid phosphatase class B